jgi:hypothetical protein
VAENMGGQYKQYFADFNINFAASGCDFTTEV